MSGRPSDGMELDELRDEFDWMFEFQSRMAERIRGDADVHNLVDYVDKLESENAKLRESVRRLMTQRDERLATAEHKSNELSEGVSRHLLCIACLASTCNAADNIIVRCRDCKHYTDHSINLHPHWCRKHGSYHISPDFFCAWGERRGE